MRAYLRGFAPGSTHNKVATVASRWQCVGDLIGSGFEPYTSRTRTERLTTYVVNSLNCFLQDPKRKYCRIKAISQDSFNSTLRI